MRVPALMLILLLGSLAMSSSNRRRIVTRARGLAHVLNMNTRSVYERYTKWWLGYEKPRYLNVPSIPGLPRTDVSYQQWAALKSADLLSQDRHNLHVYSAYLSAHLSSKVPANNVGGEMSAEVRKLMEVVVTDLNTMASLLYQQLLDMNVSDVTTVKETIHVPRDISHPSSQWRRSAQGYVILRDLLTYMKRVRRDLRRV